ncbi:restriction endonuclease subunit S [Ruminococcus flavefaciens]|uniref:restriction endonuclease subunit S n=1 Tax=Ruminococcus flavefaciens TaxID=1265 RepID=UPI0026EE1111|nr:restriction endonuclease subunit S [Ruminococcus flavefaciens]
MMSEWKKVSVSDLGRIVTGKTPKTAISEYYGGCIPFLTPSDDMSVKYVLTTSKTITEDGKNSVKNAVIPKNSICVSCIGSDLGKVVITTKETVTNQQINSVIVNTELYDVDFVYYAMVILGKVLNYHSKTSTAVPIVNKSTFSQYEILCPVLSEQRKIARILSEIDSKIAINTAINENLRLQAA